MQRPVAQPVTTGHKRAVPDGRKQVLLPGAGHDAVHLPGPHGLVPVGAAPGQGRIVARAVLPVPHGPGARVEVALGRLKDRPLARDHDRVRVAEVQHHAGDPPALGRGRVVDDEQLRVVARQVLQEPGKRLRHPEGFAGEASHDHARNGLHRIAPSCLEAPASPRRNRRHRLPAASSVKCSNAHLHPRATRRPLSKSLPAAPRTASAKSASVAVNGSSFATGPFSAGASARMPVGWATTGQRHIIAST